MIQIKRNNEVFFTLEDVCEGSKLSRQLMDHHYIVLKFSTEEPVYFEIGDSVEIPDFGYFELTSAYFPKHNEETDGYDYEMQMDAYYMAWKNKICKYRPQYGANETSFNLTTTVDVHLGVILGNLKALGLKYNGKDFSVDYTTYNKNVFDVDKRFLVSYDSISIIDVLNAICAEEALNCEWWIDGSIIYLGYCEMVGQVTFEQGVNMLTMSQSESKSSYITRLYAFGSDKNIPTGYFTGSDADVTTDGVAADYLMLPNKEVDEEGFYSKDGYLENINVVKNDKQAIEGVVKFDDEYPKVDCSVSAIRTYDSTVENDDGTKNTETFWQVASNDSFATNFTVSWIKRNLTLMIKFTSGALTGMEFEASFKIIEQKNYFEIVANETYGRKLPDKVLCPKVGDKFFLYNWDATKVTETSLIPEAQEALYERAKTYYKKSMIDNSNFTCEMDGEKFFNNGTFDYHPLGEQVKLINPMFSDTDKDGKHYRNSRIIGMEINLDIPYDNPQYIVGEKASYSRLGQLEDKVDSITVNGIQIGGSGSGGSGVYVIGMNDSTPATDSNVYSARRSRLEFLSKLTDDTAQGLITFQKGFHLGSDGRWYCDANGKAVLSQVILDLLQSADYDDATQTGFGFYKRKDGKYGLNITDLSVWGKAMFNNLTIRELSYVGGNLVFSPSAGKIFEVREVRNANTGVLTGWKCYLLADDGTTATTNMWAVDDQVKCETFNIASGVYENVSNKYYWRKVTEVSSENEVITDADGNILYDGKKYAWIVISATDMAENSDIPAAGDTIVLEGNRTNTDRQSFVVKETYGDDAPREVGYTGVNSYSLTGHVVYEISPKRVRFYTQYYEQVTVDGTKVKTINDRGEWKDGGTYYYYDQVSHNGTLWLCIAPEGEKVTEEPTEDSQKWRAMTAIVKPKLVLYHDLGAGIALGETHQITCRGFLGDKDITSTLTDWKVTRSTGDSLEDKAWLTRDKVKIFNGIFSLTWVQDTSVSDMGSGDTAVFQFSAKMASGEVITQSLGISV